LNSCVAQVLKVMRYQGHFTFKQCEALDLAQQRV
jgi:hypothetical protein